MTDTGIIATVKGSAGVVGAQNVFIANLHVGASRLPAQPPQSKEELEIPPCPYPGLAYFGPQNSALFFGRDTAITRLETALTTHNLTALVGASGSGKSSVVLAGVAPRLHAKGGWLFTHFRVGTEPDKNPFFAVARALVPLFGKHATTEELEEVQKLAVKLNDGAVTLSNVIGACRNTNPGKRILLIADQFEEIFTLIPDEALCNHFIRVLLSGFPHLLEQDRSPPDVCLIITLRADFYGMALGNRSLADALQGRVENLGPMTRDELREAIVKPAGVVTFESGLIDTLLDDVARQPGSLPLLQFALREMWARLQKRQMTRAVYDAIGGVDGALAQRAQAIFDSLTAKGTNTQAVVLFRQLFTRLVSIGEGAEDTRRAVVRGELGQQVWALAQRLADENNRLVVTSAPAPGHETVELTHEALIHNWPQLVDWLERDRAFQSWLRQMQPRVEEWRRHSEDDGTLLRGGPLKVAEEWVQRRGDEINEHERAYIHASLALREEVRRQEEEAAQREQHREAELRATRTQKRLALAGLGLLVCFISIGVTALWQGQRLRERAYAFLQTHPLSPQVERAIKPGDPAFKECSGCPEMVVIPEGEFTMGSNLYDEQPAHRVMIPHPFAIAKFEATFDEWDACVANGACAPILKDEGWGRGRQPVINVSWSYAQQYVGWLGRVTGKDYSLLTEAQWEYAARAHTSTFFYFSNDETQLGQYAWYADNAGRHAHPADDLRKPNAFGLYNMHGNVSEWVEDCYNPNYRDAPSDGSAWSSGNCSRRVVRGGSWMQKARMLRSSARDWLDVNKSHPDTGFRVVRQLVH